MIKKYGINRIGSYPNFNRSVKKHKLKPQENMERHPRFEKKPGEQEQVDWKKDISISNKYGEIFTINVLHLTLKFSRYSHLDLSVQKRFDEVLRWFINSVESYMNYFLTTCLLLQMCRQSQGNQGNC